METLLILIASVAMLVGPTLLVGDDPADYWESGPDPLCKHSYLDLYSH